MHDYQTDNRTTVADDTLNGAAAIAAYTGKTGAPGQSFALNKGSCTAFKIGHGWHMRKSTYQDFIARLEAEGHVQGSRVMRSPMMEAADAALAIHAEMVADLDYESAERIECDVVATFRRLLHEASPRLRRAL